MGVCQGNQLPSQSVGDQFGAQLHQTEDSIRAALAGENPIGDECGGEEGGDGDGDVDVDGDSDGDTGDGDGDGDGNGGDGDGCLGDRVQFTFFLRPIEPSTPS